MTGWTADELEKIETTTAPSPPGAIGGAGARAAGLASDPSIGGSQAEREQRG